LTASFPRESGIRGRRSSRGTGETLENFGAADGPGFFAGLDGAEHGGILEQRFQAAFFNRSHAEKLNTTARQVKQAQSYNFFLLFGE
jgi:hypothetical protein